MAVLLSGLAVPLPPSRAGSITASSIWDRSNALERAREQLPPGVEITREHCQDVEVGLGNTRYLCTVDFQATPASPSPAPPAPVAAPTPLQ